MRKLVYPIGLLHSPVFPKLKTKARGIFFLMALVITKRVKVANELYKKSDAALLAAGRSYSSSVSANSFFTTPDPTLIELNSALDNYDDAITAAATGGEEQTALKNAVREIVLNYLSTLGSYVESIANLAANVTPGAIAVIESAGMRPKPFNPRGKQEWEVMRGDLNGTLNLTATAIKRGTHEWQYNYTPTNDNTWVSVPSTLRASTTISGLTRGSFVSCRHRTVTKDGTSDWEGADPVVVG